MARKIARQPAPPPDDVMRPPLVLVTWEDANTMDEGTWVNHPDKHEYKPLIVHQVGFLLYEGDDGIILTHAWHTDQIAPRDSIPRAMVQKIVRLKG